MTEKSKTDDREIDFMQLYAGLTDHEIKAILKKRNHYQKEAAEAAINEAKKRGIINSEQDLFAEDYREKPLIFSIFPKIENNVSSRKVTKSLVRSLLFVGAIIIAWGAWELYRNNTLEGIVFVTAGTIWGIISFSFFKKVVPGKIKILFFIELLAAGYVAIKLSGYKNIVFTDVFIVIVLFGFVFYGLTYLKKLNN